MYGLVALTEIVAPEKGAPKRTNANDNWTLFYLVEHRQHAKQAQSDARWKLFTSLYGEARIRRHLRDADLQMLFAKDEQLQKFLPNPATRSPEDVHATERDYDLAKVLFDALSADKQALHRLASRARIVGMNPDQVRRAEAAEKEIAAALRQCARWNGYAGAGLRGAKDVKSVLVLRAKADDGDGQKLARRLVRRQARRRPRARAGDLAGARRPQKRVPASSSKPTAISPGSMPGGASSSAAARPPSDCSHALPAKAMCISWVVCRAPRRRCNRLRKRKSAEKRRVANSASWRWCPWRCSLPARFIFWCTNRGGVRACG